jgi:WD40 repeat protein
MAVGLVWLLAGCVSPGDRLVANAPPAGMVSIPAGTNSGTDPDEVRPRLLIVAQYGGSFLRHDAEDIWSVDFSPDGTLLATAASDGNVYVWDLRSARKARDIPVQEGGIVYCVRFAPGGTLLTSSGSDVNRKSCAPKISLWNVADGRLIRTFDKPVHTCHSLRLIDRGRKVIAGGQWGGGGDISIWDMDTGKRLRTFDGDMDKVHSIEVSTDESLVVTGDQNSQTESARLWDFQKGKVVFRFPHAEGNNIVWATAFSPDGRFVAYSTLDGVNTIAIWDVEKRVQLHAFGPNSPAKPDGITGFVFSPDNKLLHYSGHNKLIASIDILTGERVRTSRTLDQLQDLVMSPDGNLLAAGSQGHAAWIVDAETMEVRDFGAPALPPIWQAVATGDTPKPRSAALFADGSIRVFSPDTLNKPTVFDIDTDKYRSLAMSDSGDCLIACSPFGGNMRAWNSETGKPIADFQVPEGSLLIPLPGGDFAAVTTEALWHVDARDWQVWRKQPFPRTSLSYPRHTLSPAGAYLTRRASFAQIELWDLSQSVKLLQAHVPGLDHDANPSIVSGDGRHFVVFSTAGDGRMDARYFRLGMIAANTSNRVEALVAELGQATFKARDRVQRQLQEVGRPAIPALRRALKSDDPELQMRAAAAIEAINKDTTSAVKADHVRIVDAAGGVTGMNFFPESARWFLGSRNKILLMQADALSGTIKELASLPLPKAARELRLLGKDQFLALNCDTTVTLYQLKW